MTRSGGAVPSQCEQIATLLPGLMDDRSAAPAAVLDHVEACLRCQAELARYRRMLRLLGELRTVDCDLPSGLVGEILRSVERVARRRAVRSALSQRRVAYISALGMGVVAMGAVIIFGRSRASHAASATRA
jgi:hypothetical protein